MSHCWYDDDNDDDDGDDDGDDSDDNDNDAGDDNDDAYKAGKYNLSSVNNCYKRTMSAGYGIEICASQ